MRGGAEPRILSAWTKTRNDLSYCLQKVAEFRHKGAAATTDWLLKTSYEAVAREFENRAKLLRSSAA